MTEPSTRSRRVEKVSYEPRNMVKAVEADEAAGVDNPVVAPIIIEAKSAALLAPTTTEAMTAVTRAGITALVLTTAAVKVPIVRVTIVNNVPRVAMTDAIAIVATPATTVIASGTTVAVTTDVVTRARPMSPSIALDLVLARVLAAAAAQP